MLCGYSHRKVILLHGYFDCLTYNRITLQSPPIHSHLHTNQRALQMQSHFARTGEVRLQLQQHFTWIGFIALQMQNNKTCIDKVALQVQWHLARVGETTLHLQHNFTFVTNWVTRVRLSLKSFENRVNKWQ